LRAQALQAIFAKAARAVAAGRGRLSQLTSFHSPHKNYQIFPVTKNCLKFFLLLTIKQVKEFVKAGKEV
jgi:hypothetical protein